MHTALEGLLSRYRGAAKTEREKGTYFEELIACYLRNEPRYRDLYETVWPYADWARTQSFDGRDAGIDLVAQTHGTGEYHAIQCKLFDPGYRLQKADIDSFFTASGKKPFTQRVIVSTTDHWSEHAEAALTDQQPPVHKIDLTALEESQIDWSKYAPKAKPVLKSKKELREHQTRALKAVVNGLAAADRGKLIMACGTGKTFTSLTIAEKMAGAGGRVLFLVPSLNLLSQTLTEWSQEAAVPLHCFAVCSDTDIGKKRDKTDDTVETLVHELRYPATTNAKDLAREVNARSDDKSMSVVFSTYHSIATISEAQRKHKLADFDLIICDEAHRTTGATFEDEDESAFVMVHDEKTIRGTKRIYMTATPRIYGDAAKATAEKDNVALCSMDDESLFGKELHVLTFSDAVQRGLLVDYKVIVLAVQEEHVSRRLQELLKDGNNQIKVDDAAKIIGCWKALSKQNLTPLEGDTAAMRRAVAFCQVIEIQKGAKTHKVSSKNIAGMFQSVVEAYQKAELEAGVEIEPSMRLKCEAAHVDGSMNASEKETQLAWLKADPGEDTCRILSNVRCLSEGVDVPALDAVLFLTPRNSQVDVVQSVGRVMRNAPGKTRGYVVLPVVIPVGMEPHEALGNNQVYRVVWQVLQALRSHDDRFDAMINKLDLIGKDTSKMEVIAVTDKIQRKQSKSGSSSTDGKNTFGIGAPAPTKGGPDAQGKLQFEIGEVERAIYAKVVQKCGNRLHWEEWAGDIAKIAQTHIDRITGIIENPKNTAEREAFDKFAEELRDDLNPSISDEDVVEMLAQHLITKPVFEALFSDYSFASHNPMSQAMQGVLDLLQEHHLDKEADTLQRFYDSVKIRASGIESAQGKQKIVVELYDKFFRNAFPRMTERLGIVYTPVEVVDFIVRSVNDVLKSEFGQTLGSEGVHIIDPFTGTGTFITRLLQSGLMTQAEIKKKYATELHANEIVLLAYYIAAINIEAAYHGIIGGAYKPFEGICLTDTFQMYEKEDLIDAILVDNSKRRKRQKKLDIRVIMGNPPYSKGQDDANDNNQNIEYPTLDARIRATYAARSNATLKNSLYDSYIRAIRWASDRIGKAGVLGFVTNAGWIDGNATDGLRRTLADEFTNIYVFHLRGNARTSGESRQKEAGNIFGAGSRAPIAITLLVKNPASHHAGRIRFCDIGDYLTREQKLAQVVALGSINGIEEADRWIAIQPDSHGDWLKQRDSCFDEFIPIGDKEAAAPIALFSNYSSGVKTNRDAWCFNKSRRTVVQNVKASIDFYNSEVDRFAHENKTSPSLEAKDFIDRDPTRINWDRSEVQGVKRGRKVTFDESSIVPALYRPFDKQWLYFNRRFNNTIYQLPKLFPTPTTENRAIMVKQRWNGSGQLALMVDRVVELQTDGGTQCFPLYLYEMPHEKSDGSDLFGSSGKPQRRDAITDEGLTHFKEAYPEDIISKEDLFYYVYGLLHSEDYRVRFADNLGKELPRIPRIKTAADFWAFSNAGRALAELHINYENAPIYGDAKVAGGGKPGDYRVEKMRYGKDKDRTTLHYNDKITVTGIPLEAYDYVVNGRPALDWVVERQCVKTDKDSDIINDANDWAVETMKNPKYPLELFLRVITVSLETMKIVRGLPNLDILEG
ncbi:DEAD/DEAH box helicase [Hyphomicrobium sp.]|jgi:predicted helicase|uniref:DEAD/DEAH box helicase n=1 Tax=Hyphomicrobium sp. TaxID=82 RepID=UPI0035648084